MTRWKLILEWDGAPFMGWQRQDHGPSVQQALEDAVRGFCGVLGLVVFYRAMRDGALALDVPAAGVDGQVDHRDEPPEGQPLDQGPGLAGGVGDDAVLGLVGVAGEEGVDLGGGPGGDLLRQRLLAEVAHRTCPYSKATQGNIDVTVTVRVA